MLFLLLKITLKLQQWTRAPSCALVHVDHTYRQQPSMKALLNKSQSPQPETEVLSTLFLMWAGVPASRTCEAKYLPAQSAFEAHLAGGRAVLNSTPVQGFLLFFLSNLYVLAKQTEFLS